MEAAVFENKFSRLASTARRDAQPVKLRVSILLLASTGVDSVNALQSVAEMIFRAAKKEESGLAATDSSLATWHGRNRRYLKHYSAAYPPRTEAPLQSTRQPFSI